VGRADYSSSDPIPTSDLTAIDADAGRFPPSVAPANAPECHESCAASTCSSPAGDKYASERGFGHEQYDSNVAANSTSSDHVSEHVYASTASISAKPTAAYFSAPSSCASTSAVDELAVTESTVDNSGAAAAAAAAAANTLWLITDVSHGYTASIAISAEYIPADSTTPEPTYPDTPAGTAADTSRATIFPATIQQWLTTGSASDPTATISGVSRSSLL